MFKQEQHSRAASKARRSLFQSLRAPASLLTPRTWLGMIPVPRIWFRESPFRENPKRVKWKRCQVLCRY